MVITNASKLILAQDKIEDLQLAVDAATARLKELYKVNQDLQEKLEASKAETNLLNLRYQKLQYKTEHPWWKFWW